MRRLSVIAPVLAVMIGACGGAGETTGATPPTTSAPVPNEAALADRDSWDLLYIQDSHGLGVADLYAAHIEEMQGVEAVVHNRASGGLSASQVLDNIRGEGWEDWSELIDQAEVIVVYGSPLNSGSTEDFAPKCMIAPTAGDPPTRYSDADFAPYRDVLDQIYEEIWAAREGEPVVLRAVGLLDPSPHRHQEAGVGDECRAALEALNDTVEEAAIAGGATFVSTYDLFNGPDHDRHPRDQGWIGPDGIHLSSEGQAALASGLADAGFELNRAP